MKKINILLILLLMIASISCSKLETPTVNGVENVAPKSVSKKNLVVKSDLSVNNPNSEPCTKATRNLKVSLNNRLLSEINDEVIIENGVGNFYVPLDATLDFSKIAPNNKIVNVNKMTNLLFNKNNGLSLNISGTVTLDINGTDFVLDVNHTGGLYFKK